jgi:hypothetical protein
MRSLALIGFVLAATASSAHAASINTNDPGVYAAFAAGATVQTFESVAGLTPLGLASYTNALNSSTAVPSGSQLGGQIPGLHFHSGGASFNNPVGNPGTPTALLALQGGIAGDARSASNVVGPLEINTANLDLDQFIEIIFTGGLQDRVGVWLNPSLGPVTFSAFDSMGIQLEFVTGTAGNFVGIDRLANEIKFVSIVDGAGGFTIDDLTYGQTGATSAVAEPGSVALLLTGLLAAVGLRSRRKRDSMS